MCALTAESVKVRAIDQVFPLETWLSLNNVAISLILWLKYLSVTVQMKATALHFRVNKLIRLCRVFLSFDSGVEC